METGRHKRDVGDPGGVAELVEERKQGNDPTDFPRVVDASRQMLHGSDGSRARWIRVPRSDLPWAVRGAAYREAERLWEPPSGSRDYENTWTDSKVVL